MNRIRIVLLTVIAIGAIAASASPASAFTSFTSTVAKEAVNAKGGQQTFTVGSSAVKCTKVTGATGVTKFPTGQLIMALAYFECEVTGLGKATVTCSAFNFHIASMVTLGECKVEVTGGICKLTIGVQLVGGIVYANVGIGIISVKFPLTGLKYTSTAGCIGFEKEGKNGGYAGEMSFSGASGAKLAVE